MPEFYREQGDIREPESDTGERKNFSKASGGHGQSGYFRKFRAYIICGTYGKNMGNDL